jgi:serine/threonine-protein kinase
MVGTAIGTYRLADKLGDGGLGEVYHAVDHASGREAAFRIFTHEVSRDPMLADRLRAMDPSLKKLQHPNIASVYELITVGADLALFLEYVPGSTLDRVRRQAGQLEVNVAVSCAVQALRALEFAHGVGVLHHALRPTNLMVTAQGTVKVMDFGIGHALGANRKTREDRLLAVLAYLAPEQIQNQPGDASSDIYSVGVILYELLTGRLPFDHKTEFALRQAHLNEPPVPPRSYVGDLPEWLDQAVMRALAKNPASRYQNATECRAALEAALGLSTSRAAAVVRSGKATTVASLSAAPPVPVSVTPQPESITVLAAPSVPPRDPVRPPTRTADDTVAIASHQESAAGMSGSAAELSSPGTGQTVPIGATRAPRTETTEIIKPPAPRRVPANSSRGPLAALLILAVLAASGGGAYLWLQNRQSPEAEGQVAETGTAAEPASGEAPQGAATGAAAQADVPAAPPPVAAAEPEGGATPTPPSSPASRPAQASAPAPSSEQAGAAKPTAGTKRVPSQTPQAPEPSQAAQPPAPLAALATAAAGVPIVSLPDVSFRKVKLVTQDGTSARTADVLLMFVGDRLSVTPAAGGSAIRSVRYSEVVSASYAKAQKKRLGFIKSSQHLLTIEGGAGPLLLRLDKDNVGAVLAALEARSGKAVSR